MNKHEVFREIDVLEKVSKERKQIRRRLCRFIRDNIGKGKITDYWLQRKSDRRYLSDLTDRLLIDSVKEICKVLEDK